MSVMESLIVVFCAVGILFFVSGLIVLRSLKVRFGKIADRVENITMQAEAEIGAISAARKDLVAKSGLALGMINEYLEIPPSGHLLDAGINFMAHIGASDLGKNGLGLDKEQIGRVVMARNGFEAIGNRLAQGLGVPEILQRVDAYGPMLARLTGQGGQGPAAGAGGMPAGIIPGMGDGGGGGIFQMLMGMFMGGPSDAAPVRPPDRPGLPPL